MTHSNSYKAWFFLVALLGLTTLTWVVGLLDIHYKSEITVAFKNGFPGRPEQWEVEGAPNNITLSKQSIIIHRTSEERSYVKRQFSLPPPEDLIHRLLRVRGEITTLKQATRTKTEDVAAYMIWFQDKDGKTIQYHTVQALTGDFSKYRAERIVSVPDEARFFITVLINRESDGSFELTNADVAVVEATLMYQIISPIIFIFWACLVLLAVIWLVRNGGYKLGIAICVLLTLILVGILIPESVTSNVILPTYKKIARTLSLGHSEPLGIYYKIGHYLFFFAVTLTLILNSQRLQLSILIIMLLMLVFAVATEGLQLHLYNRSTRLTDIAIDISGIASALLLGLSLLDSAKKPIRTGDQRA